MEYQDPEDTQPEQPTWWRIADHVGSAMVLVPLAWQTFQGDNGAYDVIACRGGVWNSREQVFSHSGSVRVSQEVLQKKLRPVMESNNAMIAVLTKDKAYYDFMSVDPALKAQIGQAWDKLTEKTDGPSDTF